MLFTSAWILQLHFPEYTNMATIDYNPQSHSPELLACKTAPNYRHHTLFNKDSLWSHAHFNSLSQVLHILSYCCGIGSFSVKYLDLLKVTLFADCLTFCLALFTMSFTPLHNNHRKLDQFRSMTPRCQVYWKSV